jgi:hypothetical protein
LFTPLLTSTHYKHVIHLSNMIDTSNYDKIRSDAERYYVTLPDVHCPALSTVISFTSSGFNHLVFKGDRAERDRDSQMMRFKLLPQAYKLIGLTTTYQEYEDSLKEFRVRKHKKRELVTKQVQYWGLIAIIGNRKIKVILRKVGNGNIHFWSVIPAWVTNKTRDGRFIRTMKGHPELD